VPDYRVVPNPLNRFNLNDYSPLQKEADGSLKLAVGPNPVAGVPEPTVAIGGKADMSWCTEQGTARR
jgi:hypothetical protein